jgi:hypothetical protein
LGTKIESSILRVKQVGAQVGKVHWCIGRLYLKVKPWVGFSDYRKYIGPRTFWSILVHVPFCSSCINKLTIVCVFEKKKSFFMSEN